jgi:hypothetical protein
MSIPHIIDFEAKKLLTERDLGEKTSGSRYPMESRTARKLH